MEGNRKERGWKVEGKRKERGRKGRRRGRGRRKKTEEDGERRRKRAVDRIEVRGLCQETPWSHERGRDGMWRESGGEQVRKEASI